MLFEVSCCIFYGVPPWALLLSSLKEVSKKGATVSTRWTPTRELSPLDPAQRETIKCNFYWLLPGPPCGPGVQVLPQRENNGIRQTTCKEKVQFAAATRNVSPGLQGKAGSRRWWDGRAVIFGGGLGGKAPKSSSTRSKGWRLSWFFFRRRKKNNLPANCRISSDERRITSRHTAGHLLTKEE